MAVCPLTLLIATCRLRTLGRVLPAVVTNRHPLPIDPEAQSTTVVFFPGRFFLNAIGLSECWAKAAWVKSTAPTI